MAPSDLGGNRPTGSGLRPPWASSDRPIPRRVVRPLQEFLRTSAAGGLLLVAATVLALLWANSPLGDGYERFWRTRASLGIGGLSIDESLRYWVDEGLMALFFLVVGLEIKRELLTGELRDRRAAVLPAIASVGGMAVPALVYLGLNAGGPGASGWGIAMPTDIAFTLGIVALAGVGAPSGLRAFVLSLALVDDILTIAVIGVFYPSRISVGALALVVAIGGAMFTLRRIHVRSTPVYVVLGIGVWLALHASGVPPSLAGVLVAFLTPSVPFQRPAAVSQEAHRTADGTADEPHPPEADAHRWLRLAWLSREAVSPLARTEHALLPWTSFVILPLFALANAGVRMTGHGVVDALRSPVAIGIVLARVVGKPFGIALATWLGVRLGAGRLPEGASWGSVLGAGVAAGVAFTVSLFVAGLAFHGRPALTQEAKVVILATAVLAGALGYTVLRLLGRTRPPR